MKHDEVRENSRKTKLIFSSGRLLARELTPADAGDLYALNADREVIKYTGDQPFRSVADARQFLEGYRDYELYGCGRWALNRKEDGAFIGWCGLKMHDEDWVDLGFRLLRKYWGQGYATEAARASLYVGFKELKLLQVIGRAAASNSASLRVLEKLNMRFWKWGSCEGIPFAAYYRISQEEFLNSIPQAQG
jgi:RimJ/RimL family protein N-acetyltransferase